MRLFKALLFLLIILTVCNSARAGAPQLINYQGRVLDSAGQTIPDGNYVISLSIYNTATGGNLLWTETQPEVSVANGLFNIIMGSIVPLADSIFKDETRFLEVSVGGQVLAPRTQFTSVGYAHRISTLDGATAGELSGALILSPSEFESVGNAVTVVNSSDQPVFGISVDASGHSTLSFYDPADSKDDQRFFTSSVLDITVDPNGLGKISFYDPADSKDDQRFLTSPILDITVDPNGLGKISFYDPADSKFGLFASTKLMEITVDSDGFGRFSFYDPADSKIGLADSSEKKVEINRDGLIMFGETVFDTSLIVATNGDIIGLGQITMGENSSSGVQTSVLGFDNDAAGDSSTIGGGSFNITNGTISVISGGHGNNAGGTGATIGGGSFNDVSGNYATIGGGQYNTAIGDYSTIPGGYYNTTQGIYSFAAGRRAKASHDGSFVWADHTDADFYSTKDDQFIIRANGGVGIGTNDPGGLLEISGFGGDSAIILPEGVIGSQEIADEPGLAVEINPNEVVIDPDLQIMQDLVVVDITIPANGYIMVRGNAVLATTGTTGPNQVYLQIDEIPGGGLNVPFYTLAGSGDHDSPNKEHYFSMSTERIFIKTAGTYRFRLEAMQHLLKGSGATSKVLVPHITAFYIPTAYGSIYSSNPGK